MQNLTTYDWLIIGGYEFVQAAPTCDGRFEITLSKNESNVTLITDEPFVNSGLDVCPIKRALAVAIVQQYEQTPNDISASFTLDDLSEVVKVAKPWIDSNTQVELIEALEVKADET
jgi:hypothetical protein